MVAEVFAGLSAIKTAFDIAKGLKDIDDATRRNAAVIELQEKILAAQAAQSTLIERVRELEAEVTALKAWDAEKERYELAEIAPGVRAYVVKEAVRGCEPSHQICATCYADGHKSILQSETRFPGRCEVLVCHRCGADLYIAGGWEPEHQSRSRKRRS